MKKLKIVGNILTILAIVFIIKKIISFDISIEDLLTGKSIFLFIFCCFLYTGQILLLYLPWIKLVSIFSDGEVLQNGRKSLFSYIYAKSNILKYIPGNVFQYVGRNELAINLNLNHADVAAATLTEIILTIIAAFLVSAFCIWSFTIDIFVEYKSSILLLFFIGFLVLIIAFIIAIKFFNKKIIGLLNIYIKTVFKRNSIKNFLFCLIYYIINFLVNALQYLIVMYILGSLNVSFEALKVLIGSFILSWVIGYVTPGSPGGIGIRELIMSSIIVGSGLSSDNIIISAMVLYRIINVIGDILGYCISLAVFKISSKGEV